MPKSTNIGRDDHKRDTTITHYFPYRHSTGFESTVAETHPRLDVFHTPPPSPVISLVS